MKRAAVVLAVVACSLLQSGDASHRAGASWPLDVAAAPEVHWRDASKMPDTLRVCSDPNNLPFSNQAGAGFENRIAERLARRLGVPLQYTWWAQRRGFIRNTLNSGLCDVIMGSPSSMDMLLTSRAYYRSSYVFLSRQDRHLGIHSFDDPALKRLKIGVQLIGDDFANTPPAHALATRGMTRNLVGYTVYGDYRQPNPPARIVDAVVKGDVDLAVVWGPLAGYGALHSAKALDVVPVSPHIDLPYLPFVFDIALGVRRGDTTFLAGLDDALVREKAGIDSILRAYGVPRLDFAANTAAAGERQP